LEKRVSIEKRFPSASEGINQYKRGQARKQTNTNKLIIFDRNKRIITDYSREKKRKRERKKERKKALKNQKRKIIIT